MARTAAKSAVPERPRLAPAPVGSGPPVAGEDPGRRYPGRSLLAPRLWNLWRVDALDASVLIVTAPLVAAAQPLDGTVFISANVLTAADPTSLVGIKYTGRGERVIFDRRFDAWVAVNAYLFEVSYERRSQSPESSRTAGQLEFQVNPEFGSPEAVQVEVETFAPALGRLPLVVIARLADIHVNAGDELFGAGVSGLAYSITIPHRLRAPHVEGRVPQGSAVPRGGALARRPACGLRGLASGAGGRWAFISAYARDNPNREDLAESLLAYFATRVLPGPDHRIVRGEVSASRFVRCRGQRAPPWALILQAMREWHRGQIARWRSSPSGVDGTTGLGTGGTHPSTASGCA